MLEFPQIIVRHGCSILSVCPALFANPRPPSPFPEEGHYQSPAYIPQLGAFPAQIPDNCIIALNY